MKRSAIIILSLFVISILSCSGQMDKISYDNPYDQKGTNPNGGSGDITNPMVNITTPPDGITVGGTLMITAVASDDVAVSYVEFYIDDVLVQTDSTSP